MKCFFSSGFDLPDHLDVKPTYMGARFKSRDLLYIGNVQVIHQVITNSEYMWTSLLLQIYNVSHGAISNCHSEQELKAYVLVVSLLHANWTSANTHSVC